MRPNYLQVFHENRDDDVHQDELSHEYEDHEENRSDNGVNAAVQNAIVA